MFALAGRIYRPQLIGTFQTLGVFRLEVVGVVKKYQLFVDALKAGLQLKQLHPHSDIKVRDANKQSSSDFMQV
jgi:hypothetical protein